MKEWFDNESFWIDFYDAMFPNPAFIEAEKEIDKILGLTNFAGTKILDLCCGPGRHSIALAKKGYAVTGVDKTKYLLNKAIEKSKMENITVDWINKDIREFIQSDSYDLILNLYTSFGYFNDSDDDRKVVENIHRNLNKSGKIIMELMGKEILARIFSETLSITLEDGTIFLQKHKITDDWTTIENNWMLLKDNKYKQYAFRHRIYSGYELKQVFEDTGFKNIQLFGNLNGDEYNNRAKRLVLVAEK